MPGGTASLLLTVVFARVSDPGPDLRLKGLSLFVAKGDVEA